MEETFRGNKGTITVLALFAVLFTVLAYSALSDPASRGLSTALLVLVTLVPFAAGLAWLFSLRVLIHPYWNLEADLLWLERNALGRYRAFLLQALRNAA